MKVIIQQQYSLTDSRVFHDVKISRSQVSTLPNPTHQKLKKNSDSTQPNPWMDPTHDQLCPALTNTFGDTNADARYLR